MKPINREMQPAFQVIVNGHEYAVYANGKIYGFGDDADKIVVINHIPQLIAEAVAEAKSRIG